jgi:acyl phosphate:glycerol-3-phosphate acyltransferase
MLTWQADVPAFFLVGYLVGSIPVGLIVGHLGGIDIRRYGTGNIGASNIYHNLGILPAAVVGLGSFLQGFAPAAVAGLVTGSMTVAAAAATGSVIGYAWSGFLRLHGGSAVGTATGAVAALAPWGLVPLLLFYAIGGLIHQSAPSVLLGLISYVVYTVVAALPLAVVVAGSVIVFVVVIKRLEGVRSDLRSHRDHALAVILGRLINDHKPGQQLAGPREEGGGA